MSCQVYTLAALPTGLVLRYLLNRGLVLSYSRTGRFWRKKTLFSMLVIWRLLGYLEIGVVTIVTELFRLPSTVRKNSIMCSKCVTGVVFVYSLYEKQSPGTSVRVSCSNCWKNIYESAIVIWLCWRNIISISYLMDAGNYNFFDFPTAKLRTYRYLKGSYKIHPLIRESLELKMPAYSYYYKINNALLIFETNLEK